MQTTKVQTSKTGTMVGKKEKNGCFLREKIVSRRIQTVRSKKINIELKLGTNIGQQNAIAIPALLQEAVSGETKKKQIRS